MSRINHVIYHSISSNMNKYNKLMSPHLTYLQCKLTHSIITKSVKPYSVRPTLGDTECAPQAATPLLNMVSVHCHFELQMTIDNVASH
jgi:hypothetical protein